MVRKAWCWQRKQCVLGDFSLHVLLQTRFAAFFYLFKARKNTYWLTQALFSRRKCLHFVRDDWKDVCISTSCTPTAAPLSVNLYITIYLKDSHWIVISMKLEKANNSHTNPYFRIQIRIFSESSTVLNLMKGNFFSTDTSSHCVLDFSAELS